MKFRAKFWLVLGCISLIFLESCNNRVETDPNCIFEKVKDDVYMLTQEEVFWHSPGCDYETCVEKLLENPLNVDLAVYLALLNNRHLQGVFENLGIATAQLIQAGLLKNPIFALSYKFTTQSGVSNLIDMGLIQNFLEIVFIPKKKKMAQAELEATQAFVTLQILEIITQTKRAFYALQAEHSLFNLKESLLLASELSYEVAEQMYQLGNLTKLEMVEEKTRYEQAKMEVAASEIAVLRARERLNILMGLWGNQIFWNFDPHLPQVPCKEEIEHVENRAVASSLDLQVFYKRMLANAARLGINTSKTIFPEFGIGPTAEREDGIWYVGPGLSIGIPLFDFGEAQAKIAHAEICRDWNHYTSLAIDIRSRARTARFELLNSHRQQSYLENVLLPLAKQNTELTLLQHNAMQLGVFSLLEAKKAEIEMEMQSVEKTRDYWIAKTEMEMLLNGGIPGLNL